jgi:hypothetical protein
VPSLSATETSRNRIAAPWHSPRLIAPVWLFSICSSPSSAISRFEARRADAAHSASRG